MDLARFTHAHNAAIHASTKRDDAIRYLSLHDNKFIRYFTGHTKKVISLEMSPADDTFISGALDNSVRLWDLRSPSCIGLMQVQGKPVCAFDPEGLVFSVGVQSEQVSQFKASSSVQALFKLCSSSVQALFKLCLDACCKGMSNVLCEPRHMMINPRDAILK